MSEDFKYKDFIRRIIGAVMQVHNNLRNGLLINFGIKSLEFKLLINSKYNPLNPEI
jgi:hypothetical protein